MTPPLHDGPTLPTVTAVMCVKCKRLHSIDSTGYLTIHGTLTRRRGVYGKVQDVAESLGTESSPMVLCDNGSCLLETLKIAD